MRPWIIFTIIGIIIDSIVAFYLIVTGNIPASVFVSIKEMINGYFFRVVMAYKAELQEDQTSSTETNPLNALTTAESA
jgi:hypothetical protein